MTLKDLVNMVAISEVMNEMSMHYGVSAELRALIEEYKKLKNAKPAVRSSNWVITIEEERNGATVAVLRQEGRHRDLTLSVSTLLTLPVKVQSKNLRMLFPEAQLAVILMSRVAFRYGRRPESYIKTVRTSNEKDEPSSSYKSIPLDKTVIATKNQRFLVADTSPIIDTFEGFLCYVDTPDEVFIVPEDIHAIMGDAFAFATRIKEIRIEHDIFLMDSCAFRGCRAERIVLPNGLKRIEAYVFAGCNQLREVVIPDTVEYIGEGAFEDCTSLKSISFPKGLKVIAPRAFCHSGIEKADISSSIIEKGAFMKCHSLQKVTLQRNVRLVKDKAFSECTSLRAIAFHPGVMAVGDYAFRNCTSLKRVVLPSTICELGKQCFRGIPNLRVGMIEALEAFTDDLFEGTYMKDDAPQYGKEDHSVFESDVQIEFYGRGNHV